jgi:PAS domain S-box
MNEQILVIEDKNVAQISIKPKLEQLGYNVLAIKSNEIKTVINSKKIKPNLILMHTTPDEKMSGINANILNDFDSPIIHLADCSKNILKIRDSTDNVSYIAEPLEYNKLKSVIETTIYNHSQNSKENEEKYRLIFESSGIATAIIEENTTIHRVNTAFENFSGYLREELEGKKLEEFILPHQVPEIEKYYNLMRIDPESAPINYKFKFIDKFKDIKEVHSTAAMIPGTKRSIISILDINTEKKLKSEKECTENLHSLSFDNRNMTSLNPQIVEMSELSKSEILNALLENEEYQKTILSTVQTGIVVIDAETKRIIDINESALKFIGTHRDKVIGNICHKFICPADKGHCPIIDHNHVMDNSERTLLNINNEEIPIIKTVAP